MMKFLALILSLAISPVFAATYTVPAQPGALVALIGSGKIVGGDVILLQDGNHGGIDIKWGALFLSRVTIKAEHYRKAHADFIYVRDGAQNILFSGINVWPTDPGATNAQHIATWAGTNNLTFSGMDVRGGEDSANYPNWSAAEWIKRSRTGIELGGTSNTVTNSRFTGVGFGILLSTNGRALGNRVSGFSADGLRGGADNQVFLGNTVENCVSVDENHADGLQIYGGGRVVTGTKIERNRIIEWNLAPNPLQCGLQGIVAFDDFQEGLIIRNNLVVTRNGHGISIMGGHGVQILYNTVIRADGADFNWPWIAVYPSKAGQQSSDVVIANNLAMAVSGSDPAHNIVSVDNGTVTNPAQVLDMTTFAPFASSGFVDTANRGYALRIDVNGKKRPSGAANDKGAVEAP